MQRGGGLRIKEFRIQGLGLGSRLDISIMAHDWHYIMSGTIVLITVISVSTIVTVTASNGIFTNTFTIVPNFRVKLF